MHALGQIRAHILVQDMRGGVAEGDVLELQHGRRQLPYVRKEQLNLQAQSTILPTDPGYQNIEAYFSQLLWVG